MNIENNTLKVGITVNDQTITATMLKNSTTYDFLSLLPLTLKLDDYAGTEKISNLPKKLSTKDSPKGYNPLIGDIAYYVPWGNLAIFYKDFGYAVDLIKLGSVDSDISVFSKSESFNITIDIIK